LLLTSVNGKGGLYAGGFTRGVDINGYYVIDLTGNRYKSRRDEIEVYDKPSLSAFTTVLSVEDAVMEPKGWLSLPIEDMKAPEYSIKVWAALAEDVVKLINKEEKVVIACLGGHGRTGVACAILGYILAPTHVGDNPVEWIRKIHCDEAVETISQVDYVFKTLEPLGLPQDARLKTLGSKTSYQGTASTYVNKYIDGKAYVATDGKGNLIPGKDGKNTEIINATSTMSDDEFDIWYKEHYPPGRWEYD
jgi:hypothetical protein